MTEGSRLYLTDTRFEETVPFAGAGIIPVSRNEQGEIVLLLGKERHNVQWRGSFRWSGFEGGRKMGESMEETAVREFMEESMGCILDNRGELEKMLREKRYMARFRLMTKKEEAEGGWKEECSPEEGTERRTEKKRCRVHACYLVRVPYSDLVIDTFSERRRNLIELQSHAMRYSSLGDSLCFKEGESFADGRKVDTIEAVTETNTDVQIRFLDEEGERHVHVIADGSYSGESVDSLLDWFRLRRRLKEWIDSFDHPSISYSTNRVGMLSEVFLNEDHLEKQTVRWWLLSDLRRVIENGGNLQDEFFRIYFLPMLQRIVEELR